MLFIRHVMTQVNPTQKSLFIYRFILLSQKQQQFFFWNYIVSSQFPFSTYTLPQKKHEVNNFVSSFMDPTSEIDTH